MGGRRGAGFGLTAGVIEQAAKAIVAKK